MARNEWSPLEMLTALAIYSFIPYPKSQDSIDEEFARKLLPERSFESVKLRIANYMARDPLVRLSGHSGMSGGGRHVDEFWEMCADNRGLLEPALVLEKLLQAMANNDSD